MAQNCKAAAATKMTRAELLISVIRYLLMVVSLTRSVDTQFFRRRSQFKLLFLRCRLPAYITFPRQYAVVNIEYSLHLTNVYQANRPRWREWVTEGPE